MVALTVPCRIIGSCNNRLLNVLDTEALMRGQVSLETGQQLVDKLGWRRYNGPGMDADGWFIAGTDDKLTRRRFKAD